ncbi:hypothetical protein [Gordonia neofelifaecis]|uniref:Uncharacterized protein n=1 Tax=Gordonia neofelifaecis NRRL B-59395 TaxID=644548 RepID=F1YPF5_9ACTN|nr:hypothetical protein [Gordonia neofelifaecis]EGD53406.1 hypothetical protein SCNU_19050 [Gordonia neofelifaecis NRRL B-59395]
MYEVTCTSCSNKVLVEKFSPVHTSVQWMSENSAAACPEFAERAKRGEDINHVPNCLALRDSIEAQVRLGNIPTDSHRQEPVPGRIG